MDWTESPFSRIYSTPRVFTASTWMPPSVLAARLAATLVATAAISAVPLTRASVTSLLSATTVEFRATGQSAGEVSAL